MVVFAKTVSPEPSKLPSDHPLGQDILSSSASKVNQVSRQKTKVLEMFSVKGIRSNQQTIVTTSRLSIPNLFVLDA